VEKTVRCLEITGRADADLLADWLKRSCSDSIPMAFNGADRHHLSFIENLHTVALEQQLGVIVLEDAGPRLRLAGQAQVSPECQPDFACSTCPGSLEVKRKPYGSSFHLRWARSLWAATMFEARGAHWDCGEICFTDRASNSRARGQGWRD
jgi:hypothetical protein